MGFTHGFKNRIGGYSRFQRAVRDVTADNNKEPEPYEMRQIANMTHYAKNVKPMMKTLYQRMNDKGKHWVHVDKALNLLLYLLSYGGLEVVEFYKNNTYLVQSLCTYEQIDDQGKDVAAGIRQSANEIVALAGDKFRLDASREKAVKKLKAENQQDYEAERKRAENNARGAMAGAAGTISAVC